MRITIEERFWTKVGPHEDAEACWEWTGAKTGGGYGQFYRNGRKTGAHRYSYELSRGPIPAGLTIDHLCRNRGCVNPFHLEPVTNKENVLRGEGQAARHAKLTHCPKGHPYSGKNLYTDPDGGRSCRACWRERRRSEEGKAYMRQYFANHRKENNAYKRQYYLDHRFS